MSSGDKAPYDLVLSVARRLVDALRPHCLRVELAGSLRREKPMVGDIEIVAVPQRQLDLFGTPVPGRTDLDRFLDSRHVEFTKRGDRYQQFTCGRERYTVDLFLPTLATWGSVFTIRTGSWEFSRWLVTARAAGGAAPDTIAFVDGRLYESGRRLHTPEEDDVFAALGLAFISPIERAGPIREAARIDPVWIYE